MKSFSLHFKYLSVRQIDLFVFLVRLYKKTFAVALSLYFSAILQVNFEIYFWHLYFWLIYIKDHSWMIRTFNFQFNKGLLYLI